MHVCSEIRVRPKVWEGWMSCKQKMQEAVKGVPVQQVTPTEKPNIRRNVNTADRQVRMQTEMDTADPGTHTNIQSKQNMTNWE